MCRVRCRWFWTFASPMNALEVALTLVLMDTYKTQLNPNDVDRSLNEAAVDKIRKYRADYNNNPPNAITFMPEVVVWLFIALKKG
jgi:hypothetical protein